MRSKVLNVLFLFFVTFIIAQTSNDEVLFTVENEPVKVSEFLRVYNKNLELVKDESQKDVDSYLQLFVDYKLKLKEARALGFDKKPKYVREFEGYKKQLVRNYLTDSEVTEALVTEAYDRITQDVKVNHILVRLPEFEEDTTQVYNQMLSFRKRLINEDFDTGDYNNDTSTFTPSEAGKYLITSNVTLTSVPAAPAISTASLRSVPPLS